MSIYVIYFLSQEKLSLRAFFIFAFPVSLHSEALLRNLTGVTVHFLWPQKLKAP